MFDNLTPVGGDGTSIRNIKDACEKMKTLHNFYNILISNIEIHL